MTDETRITELIFAIEEIFEELTFDDEPVTFDSEPVKFG